MSQHGHLGISKTSSWQYTRNGHCWEHQRSDSQSHLAFSHPFLKSVLHLGMFPLLHSFCLDSQALCTDGQDHNQDSNQECDHWPKEAVQKNRFIMCTLQQYIIWSVIGKTAELLVESQNQTSMNHKIYVVSNIIRNNVLL